MSSINSISIEKLARLVGTPHCPVLVDVRTDEDFKADPRLVPGATRRPHGDVSDWAGEFAGRSAVVVCQKGEKLQRRGRGLAAARRRSRRCAGRRLRGLEEGGAAARSDRAHAAARPARPHRLGHPLAAEGRSHRLSVADPPLRRSARGVPVRDAGRGRGRRRPVRRDAVRHRGRGLEPSRRALHLRRHDRGVRAGDRAAAPSRHHREGRRHRASRSRPAGGRAARGVARPVADVFRRSRPARSGARCSTTPSTAGAATRRRRRTTGTPRSRAHDDDEAHRCDAAAPARPAVDARGASRLAARRGAELRRSRRPDRGDAPHPGRGEEVGVGGAVSPRAQLLHAAARPGGAAACDLYRLADAPHGAAASWRAACSCCPASSPSWR